MSAYSTAATAVFLGLAALSLPGCGSDGPFGDNDASAQARPDRVSADTLRSAVEDDQVRNFYEAVGWQAVWDEDRERALLAALEQAAAHALSTADFTKGEFPSDPAEREAALTRAALAYASALADGYTDPKELREIYTVPRPKTDVVAGLAKAASSDQVAEWLASLPPRTAEYKKLSQAFLHYLRQADSGEAEVPGGDLIRPGDSGPRVPALARALASNGYLDAGQVQQASAQTYGEAMVEAVKRLQSDYGLDSDGIVGPETLRVLNTGAADRARQLAVNLERLRWLDRTPPDTRIDVNTAAAFLDYFRGGGHIDRRRVVVGEPGWETPQLGSPITHLVANPNWVVPESIYEAELADKGPAYLRRNNMVRRDGKIVQLPGPESALGLVKFDMDNPYAIYLHDTPAKALFALDDRHRSHGCVRVDNALQFARMIAQADGVAMQFAEALAKRDEIPVKLNSAIPVRLMYRTAFVGPGGQIVFVPDAYGWDEDVARALGREARERREIERHRPGHDIGP